MKIGSEKKGKRKKVTKNVNM